MSKFDSVPLIKRHDYSDTLAASDDALAQTKQFKVYMGQVAQVIEGRKGLRSRIDQRGRQFLDATTANQLTELDNSTRTLGAAKVPLSQEGLRQLKETQSLLERLEGSIDALMDREERRFLARGFPFRNGAWTFVFGMDKLTDEEWTQAVAVVEGSQAKYELSLACRGHGLELRISTFENRTLDSKRIPWHIDGPAPYRRIRMRIDHDPAFTSMLVMRGYGNEGQVIFTGNDAQLSNILRSSRLVFADVFPDEQVEVSTNYPAQFRRLCELLIGPGS